MLGEASVCDWVVCKDKDVVASPMGADEEKVVEYCGNLLNVGVGLGSQASVAMMITACVEGRLRAAVLQSDAWVREKVWKKKMPSPVSQASV